MLRPTTKPLPAAPVDSSSFNPAKDSYFNLRKDTVRFSTTNNISLESLASSAHSVATSGQQSAAGEEQSPALPMVEIIESTNTGDRSRILLHAMSDSDLRPTTNHTEPAGNISTGNLHKLLHNKLLIASEGISPSGSMSSAISSNTGSTGSLSRPGGSNRIRSASNVATTNSPGTSPAGIMSRAHAGSSDSIDKKIGSGKASHKGSSLGIEIPKNKDIVESKDTRESKSSVTSKKVSICSLSLVMKF